MPPFSDSPDEAVPSAEIRGPCSGWRQWQDCRQRANHRPRAHPPLHSDRADTRVRPYGGGGCRPAFRCSNWVSPRPVWAGTQTDVFSDIVVSGKRGYL